MFWINNEEWFIKFVSPQHPMMYRVDGSLTIGTCDDNTKTIYINNTLRDPLLKKVICHEITHAAMFSYDVVLSIEQEEILADLIATYGEEIITIANRVFSKLREGY